MRSLQTPKMTFLLALTAFKDASDGDAGKVTKITPDTVTRFAFKKDDAGNYIAVAISNKTGPQNDGMVELIDAIHIGPSKIDVTGIDRAIIVRLETDTLSSEDVQTIGEILEAYMTSSGCDQFATAAIADIGEGQELFGKWDTAVFTRDYDGKWGAKSLGFTSVAKSTEGTYAVLNNGSLAKTDGGSLISTLLDDSKFQALMNDGHMLDGTKKKHLVRAPLQTGAYAVVDENGQTIYDENFQIIVAGKQPFVVMPAIDENGEYVDGQVTTVSGSGGDWDVRRAIPATKAGDLATAYGATPAA